MLGVQGCFVANQARIYGLNPATRSSITGLLFLSAYLAAASPVTANLPAAKQLSLTLAMPMPMPMPITMIMTIAMAIEWSAH